MRVVVSIARSLRTCYSPVANIVDVLPAQEYRIAAIRGAIHLPLPKLLHNAKHALDHQRPIVCLFAAIACET